MAHRLEVREHATQTPIERAPEAPPGARFTARLAARFRGQFGVGPTRRLRRLSYLSGWVPHAANRTHWRAAHVIGLGLVLVAGLSGCGISAPIVTTSFESCANATTAVKAAGEAGLWVVHEQVYAHERCFEEYDPHYTYFPVYRQVAGTRCHLGYTCIEMGVVVP